MPLTVRLPLPLIVSAFLQNSAPFGSSPSALRKTVYSAPSVSVFTVPAASVITFFFLPNMAMGALSEQAMLTPFNTS